MNATLAQPAVSKWNFVESDLRRCGRCGRHVSSAFAPLVVLSSRHNAWRGKPSMPVMTDMRTPEETHKARLDADGPAVPEDREAELRLVCCCLLGGAEITAEAMELVRPQLFFSKDCQEAFLTLGTMLAAGDEINSATFVTAWLKTISDRGLPTEILNVLDSVPAPSMVSHYALLVTEAGARRRLFHTAHEILASINDRTRDVNDLLSQAENRLLSHDISNLETFDGPACRIALVDDLDARVARQGAPTGIVTGFTELDRKTDGLQRGEQTIIGARPSMGKTAIGLCVAARVCLGDGVPTLFVTLEMGKEALLRRMASIYCSIPMFALRKGSFNEADGERLVAFSNELSQSPFYVLDAAGGADDRELGAAIRRKIRRHGIQLVIIDYLQKIRASQRHEKRTYEVAAVSGLLKVTAVRSNVAMLTMAQLNRESEKTKGQPPRLIDLADSGQIERDADTVCLLHRERDNPDGDASLIVAKNRDGEIGLIELTFDGRFCRFTNRTLHQEEQP